MTIEFISNKELGGSVRAKINTMIALLNASIGDAPVDSKIYGRRDGSWVEIPFSGGIDGATSSSISNDSSVPGETVSAALETISAQTINFNKSFLVVGENLEFLELDRVYDFLVFVSIGRVLVHEGIDFTTSVESGKTRITWSGSLQAPDGEESIESGDVVFFAGMYRAPIGA